LPPDQRPIPRFVAEPPHEGLPSGRFEAKLGERFRSACAEVEAGEEEIGEAAEIIWFPDRTYAGRTYVPAVAPTSSGVELFGFVSYPGGGRGGEGAAYEAFADVTAETAAANPGWKLDLSDHELEDYLGLEGRGTITLVWGRALVPEGEVATAELGTTTTDQCPLVDDRFSLVSLDDYSGDLLEVRLYGRAGRELATESLYEGE